MFLLSGIRLVIVLWCVFTNFRLNFAILCSWPWALTQLVSSVLIFLRPSALITRLSIFLQAHWCYALTPTIFSSFKSLLKSYRFCNDYKSLQSYPGYSSGKLVSALLLNSICPVASFPSSPSLVCRNSPEMLSILHWACSCPSLVCRKDVYWFAYF